jgi:hypothetical protein
VVAVSLGHTFDFNFEVELTDVIMLSSVRHR